tara:strand:- start:3300 stop:4124 length:825 start_codon:yes stop_codon:yes gene_type:complete
MPELPEVETSLRGVIPYLQGKKISSVVIRKPKLRWKIPNLHKILPGLSIYKIKRRAKYLLYYCEKNKVHKGILIIHLGMSGSIRIVKKTSPLKKHDHFDLIAGDVCLRMCDPRRFGAILWTSKPIELHPLISHLGPEPLSENFDADYLFVEAKRRAIPIKQFLMDNKVVVGIGNIYATESLFLAGIHPGRLCKNISRKRLDRLVNVIKKVLLKAIKLGGTSLKDFYDQDGNPGYFQQNLYIYGRKGKCCKKCDSIVKNKLIGQRASAYCPNCQK